MILTAFYAFDEVALNGAKNGFLCLKWREAQMLKLISTAQVPPVHPPKIIQTMSTLMMPSWKFKELQLLSVKSIMTILLWLELISFLACQNVVIAMNFATSVI